MLLGGKKREGVCGGAGGRSCAAGRLRKDRLRPALLACKQELETGDCAGLGEPSSVAVRGPHDCCTSLSSANLADVFRVSGDMAAVELT